jgi:hypothetical protein
MKVLNLKTIVYEEETVMRVVSCLRNMKPNMHRSGENAARGNEARSMRQTPDGAHITAATSSRHSPKNKIAMIDSRDIARHHKYPACSGGLNFPSHRPRISKTISQINSNNEFPLLLQLP